LGNIGAEPIGGIGRLHQSRRLGTLGDCQSVVKPESIRPTALSGCARVQALVDYRGVAISWPFLYDRNIFVMVKLLPSKAVLETCSYERLAI
jgi:hypothetical protein